MKIRNLDLEQQLLRESKENLDLIKQERKAKILADYRKYAHINDTDPIDIVDEWALNEACFQNNYSKDLLRKELEQFKSQ